MVYSLQVVCAKVDLYPCLMLSNPYKCYFTCPLMLSHNPALLSISKNALYQVYANLWRQLYVRAAIYSQCRSTMNHTMLQLHFAPLMLSFSKKKKKLFKVYSRTTFGQRSLHFHLKFIVQFSMLCRDGETPQTPLVLFTEKSERGGDGTKKKY